MSERLSTLALAAILLTRDHELPAPGSLRRDMVKRRLEKLDHIDDIVSARRRGGELGERGQLIHVRGPVQPHRNGRFRRTLDTLHRRIDRTDVGPTEILYPSRQLWRDAKRRNDPRHVTLGAARQMRQAAVSERAPGPGIVLEAAA